jgi:hypothetical protein
MKTFLARIANQLPVACIWAFPDAVVEEASRLLHLELMAAEAEIEALDAEIAANDTFIADLSGCLASLRVALD